MQTKVTIRENSRRIEKFQTKTILCAENGHQVILKFPITETALPFINTIADREKVSQEYLKNHFDVLCGNLRDGYLKYDYLPYQTLLNRIAGHLANRHWEDANALFQEYINRLNSLPKLQIVPDEFLKTFACEENVDNIELECLSRGLLDLVPRNILVDDGRWVVVDHEWSFDFPVPIVFIVFRAVREVAIVIQSEIRSAVSWNMPVTDLFAIGLKKLYVPVLWAHYVTGNPAMLSRMLRWELGFQRYVRGSDCRSVGRIIKTPKTRTKFSSLEYAYRECIATTARRILKLCPGLRTVLDSFERKLLDLDK